jgi:hypothetical protein
MSKAQMESDIRKVNRAIEKVKRSNRKNKENVLNVLEARRETLNTRLITLAPPPPSRAAVDDIPTPPARHRKMPSVTKTRDDTSGRVLKRTRRRKIKRGKFKRGKSKRRKSRRTRRRK